MFQGKKTICFCLLLAAFSGTPVLAADPSPSTGRAVEYPAHLAQDANYVFAWGSGRTGDYIRRDSLEVTRHAGPSFYEIRAQVAFVGDALEGQTEIGSLRDYVFAYSFEEGGRRLLYKPPDRESWLYIDATNNRGMNSERKAIGEMAYYLAFGKPFYGYLGGYDSSFYTTSGTTGLRGAVLAAKDEKNSYYVCPGTIHETEQGFSLFVKIGPDTESLKDYIMEFALMDGIYYYSLYIQDRPPVWKPLLGNAVCLRIYQSANRYRKSQGA